MTPNLRATLCVCLALCLQNLAPAVRAQTLPANPENVLRTQLIHQRFVLSNLSGADNLNGEWDGQVATLGPLPWHMLAALTVQKVKLKGNQVTIEAKRNLILRDSTGSPSLDPNGTPVTLTLTLKGDPDTLAPTLRDALFFPSLDAAIAAVPKSFQPEIPPQAGLKQTRTRNPICDCADTHNSCLATDAPIAGRPQVLSKVEPQATREALARRVSGIIEVGVQLDDTGAIQSEWILRGLGYGLDEQAAIAVHAARFAPATCHNKPVATTLFVGVHFDIR